MDNSLYVPDQNAIPQMVATGGISSLIDQTVRYPVGKLFIDVKELSNLELEGDNLNVYIRIQCNPYTLFTKKAHKIPVENGDDHLSGE
jgi:hypothetical protein